MFVSPSCLVFSGLWRAAARKQHGDQPVLVGLDAISAVLGGALWRVPEAVQALPPAVHAVETAFNSQ